MFERHKGMDLPPPGSHCGHWLYWVDIIAIGQVGKLRHQGESLLAHGHSCNGVGLKVPPIRFQFRCWAFCTRPSWFCVCTDAEQSRLHPSRSPPNVFCLSVSGCYNSIFLDFSFSSGRLRATQIPPRAHVNLGINLSDIFALLPMQKGSAEPF